MTSVELWLEPLGLKHAAKLFAALNDDRVGLYIGGPDVTTIAELRDRILYLQSGPPQESNQRWFNYAVLLNSQVVGRVEATAHDGLVEIAYLIGPANWSKGIGSSATDLLLAELREQGELEFWATTHPGNLASKAVLQKLGFTEVAPSMAPMLLSYDEGDLIFRLIETLPKKSVG